MSQIWRNMILVGALSLLGCAQGRVFKSGQNESKPEAIQILNKNSANLQGNTPTMTVRYRINVSAVKSDWQNMCSGIVTATIYSDFQIIPQGTITCEVGGLTLNAADLFKGANVAKEELNPQAFPHAGLIQRSPNPAPGAPGPRFNPPMPKSLGPLIQDHTQYEGFKYAEKTMISGSTYNGQPIQDGGAWEITVLETNASYTSEANAELVYNNIIHWELKTYGFELSPRSDTGIFEVQEFWYNTRPIAIPKFVFTNELRHLIPPGKLPAMMEALGSMFLGKVQITATIMDETRL